MRMDAFGPRYESIRSVLGNRSTVRMEPPFQAEVGRCGRFSASLTDSDRIAGDGLVKS